MHKPDLWKICPVSADVPCDQVQTGHCSMGSDVEIGQRRLFAFFASPVLKINFACQKQSFFGDFKRLKSTLEKRRLQFLYLFPVPNTAVHNKLFHDSRFISHPS